MSKLTNFNVYYEDVSEQLKLKGKSGQKDRKTKG